MGAVGGSAVEISIDGRSFPLTKDVDVSRMLGGYSNEVQGNGDGSARLIKTREPWLCGDVVVSIDDSRDDQTFLQERADRNDFVVISITFASGKVFSGQGQIIESPTVSTANTTASLGLSGPHGLTPQ